MKIATWNINGLRARFEFLLHWLQARQPDLVGLQELKMAEERFPFEALKARGYHAVGSRSEGLERRSHLEPRSSPNPGEGIAWRGRDGCATDFRRSGRAEVQYSLLPQRQKREIMPISLASSSGWILWPNIWRSEWEPVGARRSVRGFQYLSHAPGYLERKGIQRGNFSYPGREDPVSAAAGVGLAGRLP